MSVSAKCLNCNETITSRHRYDFVTCSCYNLSSDLISSMSYKLYNLFKVDMCVDLPPLVYSMYKHYIQITASGIFLDGGGEFYTRVGGKQEHLHWIGEKKDD